MVPCSGQRLNKKGSRFLTRTAHKSNQIARASLSPPLTLPLAPWVELGGGAMACHLLLVAVVAGFAVSLAGATDHIVGANHGWNPNIDYSLWSGNQTFYVGDLICKPPLSISSFLSLQQQWFPTTRCLCLCRRCSVQVPEGDAQRVRGEPDGVRQLHHGRGRRQLDLRQGLHPAQRLTPLLLHLRQRLLPGRHEGRHHRPPAEAQCHRRRRQEPRRRRSRTGGRRCRHAGRRRVDGSARRGRRSCRHIAMIN